MNITSEIKNELINELKTDITDKNILSKILESNGWINTKDLSLYPIAMETGIMKLKWNSEISGIYIWINKINGKLYIGKSKNIYTRINTEKWLLTRIDKKSKLVKLENAIKKYGINNFDVRILLIISEKLSELEQLFISYYDSKTNGYNCTTGGEGVPGKIYTQEEKQKQSKIQKSLWTESRYKEHKFKMKEWFNNQPETIKNKIKMGNNWWLNSEHKQKHLNKLQEYHKTHKYPHRKKFQLLSPSGDIVLGDGISNFAIENNMCEEMIRRLLQKKILYYKGWKLFQNNLSF